MDDGGKWVIDGRPLIDVALTPSPAHSPLLPYHPLGRVSAMGGRSRLNGLELRVEGKQSVQWFYTGVLYSDALGYHCIILC